LTDCVTMVELDEQVAAVWQTILGGQGKELADAIVAFDFSVDSVREALNSPQNSLQEKAFTTILRNRVNRGGILAPGAGLIKDGENGRGLASRWYPETLKKRILDIVSVKERIDFIKGDGIEVMKQNSGRSVTSYFIDPPYTVAAKRLYTEWEIDHDELFEIAGNLTGDFLMTYDDDERARSLAKKHGFEAREVLMKNTHHSRTPS
jgi:DNA adenine methylase